MSPATTCFVCLASANARMPVPVPTSMARRGRRFFSSASSASRQPAVVPMAGAEGERSGDLDADMLAAHDIAVMLAMDQDAAGAHGLQAIEAGGDPILLVHGGERRVVDAVADDRAQHVAHGLFVGMMGEIDLDLPGRVERGVAVTPVSISKAEIAVSEGRRPSPRSSVSARAFSPEVESSRTVATVDGRRPSRMTRD